MLYYLTLHYIILYYIIFYYYCCSYCMRHADRIVTSARGRPVLRRQRLQQPQSPLMYSRALVVSMCGVKKCGPCFSNLNVQRSTKTIAVLLRMRQFRHLEKTGESYTRSANIHLRWESLG